MRACKVFIVSSPSLKQAQIVYANVRIGTLIESFHKHKVAVCIILIEGAEKGEFDLLIALDVVADVDEPRHLPVRGLSFKCPIGKDS